MNLNGIDPAGSMTEELSDQDLAGKEGSQAGGIWTIPGTSTIGAVCTVSWECNGGTVCGIG
ncbi:plantaricin C family lantibiotic [Streptomonospora wellingtoniae]|uniref:Plantaricin C family lantibiotic n=1 Tax=Streptomonospora wellingtoniae TaxID=3075544 RepID=A0ABU2KVY3_9ACTN|nr:plantaricin C family lantibiotic [Streptomonospora sp. DSM 45055]MDT0303423.1 plantaricin C family lantibiotic [Streptomonospora sp. DSM 45055]